MCLEAGIIFQMQQVLNFFILNESIWILFKILYGSEIYIVPKQINIINWNTQNIYMAWVTILDNVKYKTLHVVTQIFSFFTDKAGVIYWYTVI